MSDEEVNDFWFATLFLSKLRSLSRNKKIIVVLSLCLVATLVSYVAASTLFSMSSTVIVPAGLPTPTPIPLTNTFTTTATLNGTAIPNPTTINLPSAYIGTQYTIVYTFTSTANQPINVTASAPNVTGSEVILWDATTIANGHSAFLGSNGNSATMTMYVTLGSVGGTIPLVFTATP